MEKFINLQLFAEEAAESVAAESTEPAAQQKDSKAEAKYTDADLDKIINQKFAEWQKKQDKTVEAAKAKEREAAKLAQMDAQQKAEYKLSEAEKRLAEYERKENLAEMTKTARKMLSEKNISISDELLSMMVADDAETTKNAVDNFAKAYTEAVENAVKERLKGAPPRKGTGATNVMTKAQIAAIKDPELRQKAMLENRHLYNF